MSHALCHAEQGTECLESSLHAPCQSHLDACWGTAMSVICALPDPSFFEKFAATEQAGSQMHLSCAASYMQALEWQHWLHSQKTGHQHKRSMLAAG